MPKPNLWFSVSDGDLMRNFLSIANLSSKELQLLIKKSIEIKKNPARFKNKFSQKTLLTIFEAPSLRTRLSFEVAATQMGGHAIYYTTGESTLGKKESMKEFAGSASRYADIIAARLFEHKDLEELAKYSSVPVINAMTNYEHPCQILGDLVTVQEKFKKLKGLKLAYFGDGFNNVTHSLLFGCALTGIDIAVACPKGKEFEPAQNVVKKAWMFADKSGSNITVTQNIKEAAKGADVIYTDSWMSYRIPKSEEGKRVKTFRPYQVNKKIMRLAHRNAVFMHCLPARRSHEVTDEVIDSKQSIIFDQAENRLHAQKALILWVMGK
jgi:ornithine carbamoyltransferase